MTQGNSMELIFDSKSINEGFARVAVAAFLTQLNPTLEEVSDVKTAVSEAVTNAIIHGYENESDSIWIRSYIEGQIFYIEIEDKGKGIEDVKKAKHYAELAWELQPKNYAGWVKDSIAKKYCLENGFNKRKTNTNQT